MKKFAIALLMVATTLATVVTDADARRLGGGGSIGRQSSSVSRQAPPAQQSYQPARPATPPAAAPAAPAVRPASPWRGMLGGALLGLGLGAMLSHFGLGGAAAGMISTLLMIAVLAFAAMFLFRMFARRGNGQANQPAYANDYAARTPDIGSRIEPAAPLAYQNGTQTGNISGMNGSMGSAASSFGSAPGWEIPEGFDVPGFVRNAKTYFIRLQAAWDKADVNDIREFTTPEMFAELRMQIQERGATPNNTDVVSIDADLLGVERVGDDYQASVKFTGQIREATNAPVEPFAEVWNLLKPVSGQGGWALAGIQQLP
ncbi:MAG: Tim44 domain-containing protein [Janthinobacterium lividum]